MNRNSSKRRLLVYLGVIVFWVFTTAASAQSNAGEATSRTQDRRMSPTPSIVLPSAVPATPDTADFAIPNTQFISLCLILVFGIVVLILQAVLLSKSAAGPSEVSRVTLATLVVTLATASLILGFSDKQLAPVLALFGSIIGFLLGRSDAHIGKSAETLDEHR